MFQVFHSLRTRKDTSKAKMFISLAFFSVSFCIISSAEALICNKIPQLQRFKIHPLLRVAVVGQSQRSLQLNSAKSGISSGCKVCSGKGAVNCPPCAGKGIDKINGSILERWTCKKCKGFGFLPCPVCNTSSKGLTPEQT